MAKHPSGESGSAVTIRRMMGSLPPEDVRSQARRLALAIDAIEAELDRLELGASPEAVAEALAGPVRAFADAAREAAG